MRMLIPKLLFICVALIGCDQRREIRDAGNNGEATTHVSTNMTKEQSVVLRKRIESMCGHVKTKPIIAKREAAELRAWICSLDSDAAREHAIASMEKSILAIDTHRLRKDDRERAINVIFDLEMEVVNGLTLMKSSQVRRWETRINALSRLRDEIASAKSESKGESLSEDERRHLDYFAEFVDANYQTRQKMFEYDFVFNGVKEIAPSEYEYVKKELEKFLGRPLKSKADFK